MERVQHLLRCLSNHRPNHDLTHRRHRIADHLRRTIPEPAHSAQFYFPGEGLLVVIALLYLLGLALTSVVGRWI